MADNNSDANLTGVFCISESGKSRGVSLKLRLSDGERLAYMRILEDVEMQLAGYGDKAEVSEIVEALRHVALREKADAGKVALVRGAEKTLWDLAKEVGEGPFGSYSTAAKLFNGALVSYAGQIQNKKLEIFFNRQHG